MNLLQFWGSVEMGLIYGLVAIGVLISFRVLDFPDLTADGSFPLGAGVSAILIVHGVNPWLATGAALACGLMAGFVTGWLNVRWGILHLLASILTMTALYSINLRIMGRPNVAILDETTVLSFMEGLNLSPILITILFLTILVILVIGFLFWFFSSEIGLALRATGANQKMAQAQGVRTKFTILLGIAMSNGFIALGGALFAQSQGFADVTLGLGTIVSGLAAVIIGEALFHTRHILLKIISCVLGSIVYRLAIALALNAGVLGLKASDLQLVAAIIVGIAMTLPKARNRLVGMFARRPS